MPQKPRPSDWDRYFGPHPKRRRGPLGLLITTLLGGLVVAGMIFVVNFALAAQARQAVVAHATETPAWATAYARRTATAQAVASNATPVGAAPTQTPPSTPTVAPSETQAATTSNTTTSVAATPQTTATPSTTPSKASATANATAVPQPTAVQPPPPSGTVVITARTRIRSAPSTANNVILGVLVPKDQVLILAAQPGPNPQWYRVRITKTMGEGVKVGQEGWIAASVVRK